MTIATYRLVLRADATRDVTKQARYFKARESGSLADHWRQAVTASLRSLQTLPERGALLDPRDMAMTNIRRLPIAGFEKHLMYYHVDPDNKVLTILRVLHGARQMDDILFAESQRSVE